MEPFVFVTCEFVADTVNDPADDEDIVDPTADRDEIRQCVHRRDKIDKTRHYDKEILEFIVVVTMCEAIPDKRTENPDVVACFLQSTLRGKTGSLRQ